KIKQTSIQKRQLERHWFKKTLLFLGGTHAKALIPEFVDTFLLPPFLIAECADYQYYLFL
ncbi:hypothetical protein EVA_21270, partial [gut metagenome]